MVDVTSLRSIAEGATALRSIVEVAPEWTAEIVTADTESSHGYATMICPAMHTRSGHSSLITLQQILDRALYKMAELVLTAHWHSAV